MTPNCVAATPVTARRRNARRRRSPSLNMCLSPNGVVTNQRLSGGGEMRRQELSGSVQRGGPFVEDRVIGLEDVRYTGCDVEGDLHVANGGLPGEADGVVKEHLVRSDLDDQGR